VSEDQPRAAEVKKQITPDLILELYNEMLEMDDPQQQKERQAVIDVLSEHVGQWLVTDVEKAARLE
jgi:hypothetical protein